MKKENENRTCLGCEFAKDFSRKYSFDPWTNMCERLHIRQVSKSPRGCPKDK